jgi:hypothetical protein
MTIFESNMMMESSARRTIDFRKLEKTDIAKMTEQGYPIPSAVIMLKRNMDQSKIKGLRSWKSIHKRPPKPNLMNDPDNIPEDPNAVVHLKERVASITMYVLSKGGTKPNLMDNPDDALVEEAPALLYVVTFKWSEPFNKAVSLANLRDMPAPEGAFESDFQRRVESKFNDADILVPDWLRDDGIAFIRSTGKDT